MIRTRLHFFFASLSAMAATLVLADPGIARADDAGIDVAPAPAPSPLRAPNAEEHVERWYGWQTITTDGIALTLGTVATSIGLANMGPIAPCLDFHGNGCTNERRDFDGGALAAAAGLGISAGATYLFGAPIVHAVHGHWDKAGASFAMRAAPFAFATPLLASGSDDANRVGIGVLVVGAVAAMTLDASLVAREDVTPRPEEKPSLRVSPTVDAVNKGGGLSLAGTF